MLVYQLSPRERATELRIKKTFDVERVVTMRSVRLCIVIALFALTEDAAEGQLAFREKRAPNWTGR